MLELLQPLLDPEAGFALTAERTLLKTLEGGCQVPLGALATLNGDTLTLKASIIAPDGSIRIDETIEINKSEASAAGTELAKRLIEKGGDKILEMVRQNL